MKRGILVGVLLAFAYRWLCGWWARFSAPYGAQVGEMKGRAYWT